MVNIRLRPELNICNILLSLNAKYIKDAMSDNNEIENARVGYQEALGLIKFYGEKVWAIYNTMIVANSIIITGILIMITKNNLYYLQIFLPVIGLTLCSIWYFMSKRAHDFGSYYMRSAYEIEKKYLNKEVVTVVRGAEFSSGKEVSIDNSNFKMSLLSKILNNATAAHMIIFIFFLIYALLLLNTFNFFI